MLHSLIYNTHILMYECVHTLTRTKKLTHALTHTHTRTHIHPHTACARSYLAFIGFFCFEAVMIMMMIMMMITMMMIMMIKL